MFNKTVILLVLVLIAGGCRGSEQHDQHTSTEKITAKLMPGTGKVQFSITTGNTEAQQFFNQGLALIYGFNHDEARRSFERAAELDPKLAMAYWGIAFAVGPNYNEPEIDQSRLDATIEALKKARELAPGASERERAYIEALWKRFNPTDDLKKAAGEYKTAMYELYKKYPDDLDAATLYADSLMNLTPWQLWLKDGSPNIYTNEIVSVLEEIIKRNPDHMGANHMYIHAVEASKNPDRALPSAERLAGLAPASGHIVHMPSHIYIRTGDYEAAAKSNIAAANVDREYIKATGVRGMYPAMYYSHNLHFLVESYNRSGNYKGADDAAKQLVENVRGHLKDMPMLEGFFPSQIFVQLRFNKWEEVMKMKEPEKEMPITRAMWRFARGISLAGLGKVSEAEAEKKILLELTRDMPGETPFGLNTAAGVFKIAENVLDARILAAKGDRQGAIKSWRLAVQAHDDLNYDEPPGWYYSVRESLGAALLLSGDTAGAEKVFRKDLENHPGSGRSLFGLMECLKKLSKTEEAKKVEQDYLKAWRNADTILKIEDL